MDHKLLTNSRIDSPKIKLINKILGIKYYDGVFQQTMSYEDLMERWEYFSIYMNLPDWSGVSFVVEIL